MRIAGSQKDVLLLKRPWDGMIEAVAGPRVCWLAIFTTSTMLSIIPNSSINAAGIKLLRSFTTLGISDIRRCAVDQESIRDIEIFGSDWQNERLVIARIADLMAEGNVLPFSVLDHDEYGNHEVLTAAEIDHRIEHWQGIEQETLMHTNLEIGAISTPDELRSEESEWAERSLQRTRLRLLEVPGAI